MLISMNCAALGTKNMPLPFHPRVALSVVVLSVLSACATPQQQCIHTVSAEARALQAQIRETQATVARGYAVHKQTVPYTSTNVCYNKEKQPFLCPQTQFKRIETPVTVDIAAEKAKLAQLKTRFAKVQRKALSGIEACKKTYPE